MKLARALTLVALGFADVHVRANPRTFDAHDKRTRIAFDDVRVVLGKGALATAEGTSLRLVQGRALALTGATIVVPYGKVACAGRCEAIFVRADDHLEIQTLTEGWSLVRAGDVEPRGLPRATTTTVAGVGKDGRASVTTPASIPWDELVRDWAKLFPDGAEAFTARVHAFRPEWDQAVAEVSSRDHDRALAMIEAHDTADARRTARAKAAAAEDARLRQLFRQKNYVE